MLCTHQIYIHACDVMLCLILRYHAPEMHRIAPVVLFSCCVTCTIANCSRLFCLYACPCAPRCNVSWLCFRCFAVHVRCMSGNRHGYVWASTLPTLHEMHPKQKKHHCFLVNPRPADPAVVSFEEVQREQAYVLVFRLLSAT